MSMSASRTTFAWATVLVAVGLSGSTRLHAGEPGPGEGHWPEWRGPQRNGVAPGRAPVDWTDSEGVKWRVTIPGRGFSTPVIWGDRILLTTAVPTGEAPEPDPEPEGGRGRGRRGFGAGPVAEHSFEVHCLDRKSGKTLWKSVATVATPHEGHHGTYGSFASNSPATDGERVYAFFGSRGMYCYDMEGELVWKRDFGVQMKMRRAFGEGTAPTLFDDTLVLSFDHEGDSFVVALDKRTGEVLWRKERDEISAWATPLPVAHGGKKQVVVAATGKVRSYALDSGAVLWECAGLGANVIPNPVLSGEMVIAMSGYRDPNLLAIQLGKEGDLTGSEAVRWTTPKGLSYTASPVLYEGRLYALMDGGFLSCFEAASGNPIYVQQRLPRGSSFKASPIIVGGRLYAASENGDVHVIAAGDELEVITTNSMGDEFFVASPIVALDELFLRSADELFCIASAVEESTR